MSTPTPDHAPPATAAAEGRQQRHRLIGALVFLALALGLVAFADRMQARAAATAPLDAVAGRAPMSGTDTPKSATQRPDASGTHQEETADPEPPPQAY